MHHLLVVALRDQLLAVRVIPSVRDEVAARQAAVADEGGAQGDVRGAVSRAGDAQRHLRQQVMRPRFGDLEPPALPDQAREAVGVQLAELPRRLPPCERWAHSPQVAPPLPWRQPPAEPHLVVEVAQATDIVVGPAAHPGQLLRGRQPVRRDIGPEEFEQRCCLLSATLPLAEGLGQPQCIEVHAVVGRAVVLVDAALPRVEVHPLQPLVALVSHLRPPQRFPEQDHVSRVHQGDVRVGFGDVVPEAPLCAELDQLLEQIPRPRRHGVPMPQPQQ